MTSDRIRNAARALAAIAGTERAERHYDEHSDNLAHKLFTIVAMLHAEADAFAAIEAHVVPPTARAGLSAVTEARNG